MYKSKDGQTSCFFTDVKVLLKSG